MTDHKKPTHNVYTVIETNSSKAYWLKIGAGWECKDGSINCEFNALPVNGKVNVRPVNEGEPEA